MSWCFEGHHFISLLVQLPRPLHLRHLVRLWCTTTHTFFFSYGELIVTLKDVANQLLLPILNDTNPAVPELSPEEKAIEAELKKRMTRNAKLSYWVSSSSKFSVSK